MKNLLELVGKINPSDVKLDPVEKLPKGWVAVGAMDDNLKRLFGAYGKSVDRVNTLRKTIVDKQSDHIEKHLAGTSNDYGCVEHHKEIDQLNEQLAPVEAEYELFSDLFWSSVKLQFSDLIGAQQIKIVEGFQLAYNPKAKERPQSSLESLPSNRLAELLFSGKGIRLGRE